MNPMPELNRQETALLVVDVQERLFSAMEAGRRDAMVKNIKILVAAGRRLGLQVFVSEQYPKGLGHTLPELRELLAGVEPMEKVTFSCCAAEGFSDRLRGSGARNVIVTGIETHVCVLLTALDLLSAGSTVYVPADAVCSRTRENHEIGFGQLRDAGAVVTSTETLLYQLLGRSDTEDFRFLQSLIK
ncbi:MAG: hydrolase [Candidatus Rokubacteria bacterium]|nr:hydrolase [Candidatus Rokubacteria bacterium]